MVHHASRTGIDLLGAVLARFVMPANLMEPGTDRSPYADEYAVKPNFDIDRDKRYDNHETQGDKVPYTIVETTPQNTAQHTKDMLRSNTATSPYPSPTIIYLIKH